MTLLRDIQDNAVAETTPVAVLLRQCVVLASRLHHDPLREWSALELNGYPAEAELPPYRQRFATQVLGDYSGPMGSGLRNAAVPAGNIPSEFAEFKKRLYSVEPREGVAELDSLVASGENTFQIPWPADLVVAVQTEFYEHMALMRAWQVIPASAFRSVLSGIRDRVLQFALDIERENPGAGEASPDEAPIPESRVTQIFNQHFHGNNTTFAAAGRDVHQTSTTVAVDVVALSAALSGLGVPNAHVQEVVEAIQSDDQDGEVRPGPRTRRWLEMLQTRSVPIATGVTTSTVAAVVAHALGLK